MNGAGYFLQIITASTKSFSTFIFSDEPSDVKSKLLPKFEHHGCVLEKVQRTWQVGCVDD